MKAALLIGLLYLVACVDSEAPEVTKQEQAETIEVHGCRPGTWDVGDGVCIDPWGGGGGGGGGGGDGRERATSVPSAHAVGGEFLGGGYAALFFFNTTNYCYEVHYTVTIVGGVELPIRYEVMKFVGQYTFALLDSGFIERFPLLNSKEVVGDYSTPRPDMQASCH